MNGSELPVVFAGLASAASYGTGDFFGGITTKRSSVYSVVILAEIVGFALLLSLALLTGEGIPSKYDLLWGGLAGIFGAIGAVTLYLGLARGTMGIVAPVTGIVAAVIPMLFGLMTEGLVSSPQLMGFGLAIVAIWFITRTGDGETFKIRDLKLPLLSGIGFGLFYIFIGAVSNNSFYGPLVFSKLASLLMLIVVAMLTRQLEMPEKGQLPIILIIGICNSGGTAFFALASQLGRLDVAAILTSLHPMVTVLLARIVIKEKLTATQWFGVIAALIAVVLIVY